MGNLVPEKEPLVYKLIESMGVEVNQAFRDGRDGSLNERGYMFAVMMVDEIPLGYSRFFMEGVVTPENLPRSAQIALSNLKDTVVSRELLNRPEFPEELKAMIALRFV